MLPRIVITNMESNGDCQSLPRMNLAMTTTARYAVRLVYQGVAETKLKTTPATTAHTQAELSLLNNAQAAIQTSKRSTDPLRSVTCLAMVVCSIISIKTTGKEINILICKKAAYGTNGSISTAVKFVITKTARKVE